MLASSARPGGLRDQDHVAGAGGRAGSRARARRCARRGRAQWQQRALACGFALSATLQLQLLPRSIERLGVGERDHLADGGAPRDGHGKIKRSPAAKAAFKKSHPCPSNGKTSGACPGYVIDHVQALKHGGADAPNNMQWQTKEAAKAKDKWE